SPRARAARKTAGRMARTGTIRGGAACVNARPQNFIVEAACLTRPLRSFARWTTLGPSSLAPYCGTGAGSAGVVPGFPAPDALTGGSVPSIDVPVPLAGEDGGLLRPSERCPQKTSRG